MSVTKILLAIGAGLVVIGDVDIGVADGTDYIMENFERQKQISDAIQYKEDCR